MLSKDMLTHSRRPQAAADGSTGARPPCSMHSQHAQHAHPQVTLSGEGSLPRQQEPAAPACAAALLLGAQLAT